MYGCAALWRGPLLTITSRDQVGGGREGGETSHLSAVDQSSLRRPSAAAAAGSDTSLFCQINHFPHYRQLHSERASEAAHIIRGENG